MYNFFQLHHPTKSRCLELKILKMKMNPNMLWELENLSLHDTQFIISHRFSKTWRIHFIINW